LGKTLSLGRTLSLNILQLVGNRINVQGDLMFIKKTISNVYCTVTRFQKINIRHLLVNYLNMLVVEPDYLPDSEVFVFSRVYTP
jgi:hypothetical protein